MNRLARNESSKAKRGRIRPGVEGLEQRLALAVTADLVGGQLLVAGTGADEVITLDHSGTNTTVAGKTFADSAITLGILIQAGDGDDTFNLRGTARPSSSRGSRGGTRSTSAATAASRTCAGRSTSRTISSPSSTSTTTPTRRLGR